MWPFSGTILWGTVIAIVFAPVQRRLVRAMHGRRTAAALTTLALVILIVILPLTLIAASLVDQAAGVVKRVQSGELSVSGYFQQIYAALPWWGKGVLDRFGLTDLGAVQERLSAGFKAIAQVLAAQAILFGQQTFEFVVSVFVMLYLLFFLLRDGDELAARIKRAVPLQEAHQRALIGNFITVIRAIVKGTIVVAILQGALGGLAFWALGIRGALLWGVVMGVLSLLPAVGTALVWVPAALYLLATGAMWQGLVLVAVGVLVIGSVDNVVRPILVGKDTRIPDYVVLLATLGGIAIFGVNGFLIGPVIAAMFLAVWDIVIASRA
jgi:predicted PurR-regulated permease PerM